MHRVAIIAAIPFLLGAWKSWDETSRVDGARRVAVEKEQSPERYEGRTFTPVIQFECRAGVSYAWLHFDRVMGCRGQTVAYKAGEKAPRRLWMQNSTDCKSLGITGGAAIGLAQQAMDVFVVHVRATPYNSGSIELSFDVAGLREAVAPVARACRWPGKW